MLVGMENNTPTTTRPPFRMHRSSKDKMIGGPGPDLCKGGGGKDPATAGCEKEKQVP